MLVGGLAAAIQGRMRLTRDLDLLVNCCDESIPTLVEAMRREGFAHHPGADRHRLEEVLLLRFWLPVGESAVSVGVDLQLARADHLKALIAHGQMESYRELRLPVATREDLVLLKLLAWRPIDRADAIELLEVAPTPPDYAYLKDQAHSLGLVERLQDVLAALHQS